MKSIQWFLNDSPEILENYGLSKMINSHDVQLVNYQIPELSFVLPVQCA